MHRYAPYARAAHFRYAADVEVRVLGTVAATQDGEEVNLGRRQERCLPRLLLLHAGLVGARTEYHHIDARAQDVIREAVPKAGRAAQCRVGRW